MTYRVYIDGDGPDCPHDDRFEHRFYFGCVPKNFSERTGRAKGHRQTETTIDGLPWNVWLWDGGCDKAGVTAEKKLAEYERSQRAGGRKIVLEMKPRREP